MLRTVLLHMTRHINHCDGCAAVVTLSRKAEKR